jgi:hypothetical protein
MNWTPTVQINFARDKAPLRRRRSDSTREVARVSPRSRA